MEIVIYDSIEAIDTGAWNRLDHAGNPFLRHEFLSALERAGCVGRGSGWLPQPIAVYGPGPERPLLGAAPLYLKTHSYGEYVFDWAWASAYERAGLEYYPKLVAAVPFTPVTGPRLLLAPGAPHPATVDALIGGALQHARDVGASSLHWLFVPQSECALSERHGHLTRFGCQFHWKNQGYTDFDGFLAGFSSKKRKNVKRERRRVRDAGIHMSVLSGEQITPAHWDRFHAFYQSTIRNHGAIAYLNRGFFHELGRSLGDRVVLVVASRGAQEIAGALNLRGDDALYGRYWGSLGDYDGLHFETCYYSAIEYCIAHGLKRFEAGAQGEHKISRGLLPTPTYSTHWLSHPEFNRAVADFLSRERHGMEFYIDELGERSPFRRDLAAVHESTTGE